MASADLNTLGDPIGDLLGGLLGNVNDLLNDLLGSGLGDVVTDLAPGKLIKSLGKTLEQALGGGDANLLQSLLDNNLLDKGLLQDILNGKDGLNLGSLDDLLNTADLGNLGGILDDLFDDGLLGLGDTVLNLDALDDLAGLDLESVTTFLTGLLGTVTDILGDTLDLDNLLDALFAGDDVINGNDKDNKIIGGPGDDVINAGAGDDNVKGGTDEDTIFGEEGNDRLSGGASDDTLDGGSGDDKLNGGAGADVMTGGGGDDVYSVNDAGDVVTEQRGGGRDTVNSSITYTLGEDVENLNLKGKGDIDGAGNELRNRIEGNRGDNNIDGGAGNDVLIGGNGKDILTGGADDDRFKFVDSGDSGLGKLADVITDFQDGDRISFKGLDGDLDTPGDQKFLFLGDDDFTGGGRGEIQVGTKGGDTLIRVDVDGDGTADFDVRLEGIQSLQANDFIL